MIKDSFFKFNPLFCFSCINLLLNCYMTKKILDLVYLYRSILVVSCLVRVHGPFYVEQEYLKIYVCIFRWTEKGDTCGFIQGIKKSAYRNEFYIPHGIKLDWIDQPSEIWTNEKHHLKLPECCSN